LGMLCNLNRIELAEDIFILRDRAAC
jgi:hypothetical protein